METPLPPPPPALTPDSGLPPKPAARRSSTDVSSLPSSSDPSAKNFTRRNSTNSSNVSQVCPPLVVEAPAVSVPITDTSSNSNNSRHELRQSLSRRKLSLTPAEFGFLEDLCASGNEIEVSLANERLQDADLFFPEEENKSSEFLEGTSDQEPLSQPTNDLVVIGLEKMPSVRNVSTASSRTGTTTGSLGSNVGSERRQELLELRKKSDLHSKIWRAHESGLAMTKAGSRRSMQRRQSFSSLPRHRRQASAAHRAVAQDIFRTSALDASQASRRTVDSGQFRGLDASYASRQTIDGGTRQFRNLLDASLRSAAEGKSVPLVEDLVHSDNNRRRRHHRCSSDQMGLFVKSQELQPRRSSLKLGKPLLRRLQSESCAPRRKSVSFQEIPRPADLPKSTSDDKDVLEGLAEGAIPPLPQRSCLPAMVRSEGSLPPSMPSPQPLAVNTSSGASRSSIPSIHHAHPVQSPQGSVRTFNSGIPSLHHGHPVQSPQASVRSGAPSIHLAHPVMSQSFRSRSNLSRTSSITSFGDSSLYEEGRDPSESEDKKIADEWLTSGMMVHDKIVINSDENSTDPTTSLSDEHLTPPGNAQLLRHGNDDVVTGRVHKPVFLRSASAAHYEEEGIEAADWDIRMPQTTVSAARNMDSLFSFGDVMVNGVAFPTAASFDETVSYGRISNIFRRSEIPRSLSDEDMAGIFLGGSAGLFQDNMSYRESKQHDLSSQDDDVASWQLTDDEDDLDYYDPWKVIEDESANGYGGGGTLPFAILGTSADDHAAHPHVFSPPLMESLQNFLPLGMMGEHYWMKYSLVRDGASMHTLLQYARGARYSFLALETVDGEVFGAFTAEPWRKNWNYFGSGESFLWRLRQSRHTQTHSILDQAHLESEIDVFPFTGQNANIQLCTHDKLAVGGGTGGNEGGDPSIAAFEWGFGLTIESDLLIGTSSPCLTFGSPSLSRVHSDGSHFEIINLELWTMTPCMTEDEASKLELSRLFLEKHVRS